MLQRAIGNGETELQYAKKAGVRLPVRTRSPNHEARQSSGSLRKSELQRFILPNLADAQAATICACRGQGAHKVSDHVGFDALKLHVPQPRTLT